MKRMPDVSHITPGGDPTKVDPNVMTFAWNASQMSDGNN